jgi:hypothetical protein
MRIDIVNEGDRDHLLIVPETDFERGYLGRFEGRKIEAVLCQDWHGSYGTGIRITTEPIKHVDRIPER